MPRHHSKPAEVSHHQPHAVPDVQEVGETPDGLGADGGAAVSPGDEETDTVQQAGLPSR